MSEAGDMLAATALRLFDVSAGEDIARASRRGEFSSVAWDEVEAAGLPLALLSEAEGGFGFDVAEALDLIRIAGYFASPLPLGETMFANLLFARAGLPLADGPAVIVALATDSLEAHVVPWGRHARTFAVVHGDRLARIAASEVSTAPGFSASGLARDSVRFAAPPADSVALPLAFGAGPARLFGALTRSLEMAGALQRVLELTVSYAGERVQFGRTLSKLQAIQQEIAVLATQAAAARAAADFAARAFGGEGMRLAIAAAKSRTGEAAGIGAAIAQQVHGAIGFTEEHRLHLYTRALWAWRDEHGGEAVWEAELGSAAVAGGADGFWPFVTALRAAGSES